MKKVLEGNQSLEMLAWKNMEKNIVTDPDRIDQPSQKI
jgi:hypothetical protein